MTFNLQVIDGYLWFYYTFGGDLLYRCLIGAGGALSAIINSRGEQLLSPSFADEKTDRIIQWTLWSHSLTRVVPNLPEFEYRYNLTQGGTMSGEFAPIMNVDYLAQQQQQRAHTTSTSAMDSGSSSTLEPMVIDIWSRPNKNWKTEQQSNFQGGVSCLTRYRQIVIANGVSFLEIRRVILVDKVIRDGESADLGRCYLEAWTPLNYPKFKSVVFSLEEETGYPKWWYHVKQNLPFYPQIKPDTTRGYVITSASNVGKVYDQPAAILVFGQKDPIIKGDRESGTQAASTSLDSVVLNLMNWDTGVGLLPGLEIDNLGEGDLIDVTLNLFLTENCNAEHLLSASIASTQLKAPVHYQSGWLQSASAGGETEANEDDREIMEIYRQLKQIENDKEPGSGLETDRLGNLLTRVTAT